MVFIGFTEFYWVLASFIGFHLVLMGFTGFYRVFLGFYWVLLGFTEFLPGFTGFYLVLQGFTTGFPNFTGYCLVLLGLVLLFKFALTVSMVSRVDELPCRPGTVNEKGTRNAHNEGTVESTSTERTKMRWRGVLSAMIPLTESISESRPPFRSLRSNKL